MTYTPPNVYYCATNNGTFVQLTGVQSILISRGRQHSTDPFSGSRCVIEAIPANSYSLDLAVGQFLDIRASNSSASAPYFVGRITDVERSYGVPYLPGKTIEAPADRITITVQGGTGIVGTNQFVSDGALGMPTAITAAAYLVLYNAACESNAYYAYSINGESWGPPVTSSTSAITKGQPVMQVVNQLLQTSQWVMDDGDQGRAGSYDGYVMFYSASATGSTITFTDTAGAGYKYSEIRYLSSVQGSYSSVSVSPFGLATQVATASDPRNALAFDSYDATTTQALALADYVLTIGTETAPTPFVISTSSVVASGAEDLGKFLTYPVGSAVSVTFRGTTVTATVQGWELAYYADRANVSAFLSPSLGTPFTLDSTSFGVLDTNGLGYP